ncbi:bifunctional hydroxymethylpyrimidine kinase/phosphomethylpyrimidine kinase [Pseudoalteromonas sp. SMS1]|uniref:bifunctional hydroxymethylpyrimidine kinase/phosphomethylpyrimidine kinase n=1 Tax=Pseudoalteromonas sp. SMS1 TaxID=2908894 RepID=UPI001F21DE80|nr:bifunctional hydroxymethylpyrimidine kinase/phosphomethylpyrimidine kinase [Pseudoalteromonas sp. SMS1]MCF2858493.1 bifunctional hydroxymethylpyrimidine kinase/phosphomethylpyrimidine kinase [Pseudoalteromonas sp. SMS1]
MVIQETNAAVDSVNSRASVALTIAGSDSGGGAGIQADIKTFSALGTYATSVLTAITAQNTQTVSAVHDIPRDIVKAQIDAVFDDIQVDAVKIGMLSSSEIIATVASCLQGRNVPIILDPVMVAKSGDLLLQNEAVATLKSELLPLATLLTPNLPEAAVLLGQPEANTEDEITQQGQALLDLGVKAVLMKGGHLASQTCIDVLMNRHEAPFKLSAQRIKTNNTHGTGCTLSSAITALISQGVPLKKAVEQAKSYLYSAIQQSDELAIGHGHGPVHHFYRQWQE